MAEIDLSPWLSDFRLFFHAPDGPGPFKVLVCVHGISRNAAEHLAAFRAATGGGLAVLAPRFGKREFPDYQRLGLYGKRARSDLALDAALERFSAMTGIETSRFHLFGFSGGAQFAHRYALLHPQRVLSLHAAAAGWYTMPDPHVPWPYGLGRRRLVRPMIHNLPVFLRRPIHVYVGSADTNRDHTLRQNQIVDAQQGRTRVERAHRWATAVDAVGVTPIAGACHDFEAYNAPGRGIGLADAVRRSIALDAPSLRATN